MRVLQQFLNLFVRARARYVNQARIKDGGHVEGVCACVPVCMCVLGGWDQFSKDSVCVCMPPVLGGTVFPLTHGYNILIS